MAPAIKSAILLAASLPFLSTAAHASNNQDGRIARVFSGPLRLITIENVDGATEVTTWPAATVSLTASRASGTNHSLLDREVSFEHPARDVLRIVTKPADPVNPIHLTIFVPSTAQVLVRGGSGRVVIKGLTAGLSAETDSGSIAIHLPEKSNTDLSLRTIRGAIYSRLPVTIFGQTDAHLLDGKLGRGGAVVVARSQRGNISILPDDASRIVSIKTAPDNIDRSDVIISPSGVNAKMAFNTSSSKGGDDVRASEDVITLEARLVNLNVKVTDAGGKTLPALKKEDFVVGEDGVPQDISHFEPITAPLHIVLLLDLSGSTEKKTKVMKKAAQKFVDSLKPSDNIAVAGFTRRFFIISNFTTNHKLLKDRIGEIKNRHSGTAYYDAMWATLDLMEEANASRKAIVVLTDGVDNSLDHPGDSEFDPRHGFDELFARIEEADATIYPIYLDTEYETIGKSGRSGHAAYVTARKQLEALAEQTGAVLFKAERAEDLEGVYQQVAAELHSLYSLAYAPKTLRKDGKWKKISIAVSVPGAKVRTKRGYYAK